MPKNKRVIEKEDIMPLDIYSSQRKELRKKIVDFKKDRRIPLGPYATFYFESFETMLAQVQEMLYIEKGGDEQLKDELTAYNPLVPNGKELTVTLMFEIDNPVSRATFLGKVGGIEEKVFMKIDGDLIKAVPEEDVDRTSAEGNASSCIITQSLEAELISIAGQYWLSESLLQYEQIGQSCCVALDGESLSLTPFNL